MHGRNVIMAAVGLGQYASVEEVCHQMVKVCENPIDLIPANVEKYIIKSYMKFLNFTYEIR